MAYTAKMRPAFNALHAATLNPATTPEALANALLAAEAVTDRHRLSEGAVYASACRRYLLDTGRDWRAEGLTAETTTWTGSDHRYRATPDGWACSCGDRGAGGEAAHAAHAEAALV